MPGWMQSVAKLQPGRLGRPRGARGRAARAPSWSTVGWHLLFLLALTAVTCAWATYTFRAYQRTL